MALVKIGPFELLFHLYIVASAGISRHWRFWPLKIFILAFSQKILFIFWPQSYQLLLRKQEKSREICSSHENIFNETKTSLKEEII